MNWQTFEVEIDHGRITPLGSRPLPEKASGVLTVQPAVGEAASATAIRQFLDAWAGAFTRPEQSDDPRLTYLLEKHAG